MMFDHHQRFKSLTAQTVQAKRNTCDSGPARQVWIPACGNVGSIGRLGRADVVCWFYRWSNLWLSARVHGPTAPVSRDSSFFWGVFAFQSSLTLFVRVLEAVSAVSFCLSFYSKQILKPNHFCSLLLSFCKGIPWTDAVNVWSPALNWGQHSFNQSVNQPSSLRPTTNY